MKNHRPVTILNCFSKMYEKFLNEPFISPVNEFLSEFVSAYRKNYNTHYVLNRLIETEKSALEKTFHRCST